MKKAMVVGVVAVLGLAACGSSVESEVSYGSIEEFRDAVKASGVPCGEWKELPSDGATVKGTCDGVAVLAVDTAGTIDPKKVVITAMFTGMAAEQDPVMLYAQNWVLSASPNVTKRAQRHLGGEEYAWDQLSGEQLLEGLTDE